MTLAFLMTAENEFIGTKRLHAEPMSRGRYNEMRGWTIPADENPEDPGYIVAYEDGHISWSPKATFDAAYKQSGTFRDRLVIELAELEERGNKLEAFTQTPVFAGLEATDQMLLSAQAAAMAAYEAVLRLRTARAAGAVA